MSVIDLFEKLINEHGSSIILRDHLAFLRDQFAALEKKLAICMEERTKLKAENENIKAKIDVLERKQKTGPKICPNCGEEKGKLIKTIPDPIFGDLGGLISHYKCENCGWEYDKEQTR